jgi:hypothetical protein
VKLFQIEEPDGTPSNINAPGVAIGIDAGGATAEVAVAVGGNASVLRDRDGFEQRLPVPARDAPADAWRELFEGARLRAERALGRPVTHAVLALPAAPDTGLLAALLTASEAAGLALLQVMPQAELGGAEPAAAAAILAEDLAPRPTAPS